MARRTREQRRQLMDRIEQGVPEGICKALKDAGYPDSMARQGWNAVPQKVMAMLSAKGRKLMELGRNLTPELQEHLVRGRLAHNTMIGKDGGAMSAKLLGSDKRVNMFVPDNQMGVIVLSAPFKLGEQFDRIAAEADKILEGKSGGQ
jgi:hypothetical protein